MVDWTAYVLFVVVIGGVRTIEGPVSACWCYGRCQFNLSGYGSLYLLMLGLIAILVMLFVQRGIWEVSQRTAACNFSRPEGFSHAIRLRPSPAKT